ncbi:unnamed protein product [Fraxinus pennsylvanica]|uniref:Uncharacterized protein n=1 Tax=Fraxinus pennsylvanica TaxID=56036 RepID=A0AAD2A860_9LAMI|nr:unnamed protein product [Fraxinus pennsylvanica]
MKLKRRRALEVIYTPLSHFLLLQNPLLLIVRYGLRDSTWSVLAASPPRSPPPLRPSPTANSQVLVQSEVPDKSYGEDNNRYYFFRCKFNHSFFIGKKGGSSWLTAVKRAFRTPVKDSEKRNNRNRNEQEEIEAKKREKRWWLFRKQNHQGINATPPKWSNAAGAAPAVTSYLEVAAIHDERHVIAMAMATPAAADAAVVTAQAVSEVARFSRPRTNYAKQRCAAIVIQTAFRGYLICRGGRDSSLGNENELGEKHQSLERWMAAKPWASRGRASTDQRDYVKTVEIDDTPQLYSYLAPNFRMSSAQHQQRPSFSLHRAGVTHQNQLLYSPVKPSTSKTRPKVCSASPHCAREERSYYMAQTTSIRDPVIENTKTEAINTSEGKNGSKEALIKKRQEHASQIRDTTVDGKELHSLRQFSLSPNEKKIWIIPVDGRLKL